jgi:CHAT domain-containing protein
VGTSFNFRAEQVLEFEQVFLDGIIQIKDELLILDAIYSLSTPSEPLQIARIIQELEPTCLSVDEFEKYSESAISSAPKSDDSLANIDLEQFKLEIDSFPIVKNYRVSLSGNIGTEPFNSLDGYLYVTFASEEEEKPKSIQLISKLRSGLEHGFINWNCESLEQFFGNDWYSLTKTNEVTSRILNINLEYRKKLPSTNFTWYSKTENSVEQKPVPVMAENIGVSFKIDGDRVTGSISASGYYSDSLQPNTYQATIVGEIEKSQQVEELRQVLNSENSNFTGCWLSDATNIREITLQQNGDRVTGSFNKTGEIVGIVAGNLLEFSWTNGAEQGWGYFRSLNRGGTLSGMWGNGEFSLNPQGIVGHWQSSFNAEVASWEDEIFLREFRFLGQDLVSEGRYEQGIAILESVVQLYRDRGYLSNLDSQEELSNLLGENFILVANVLRFNVYLGDYNKLIQNLDRLLEIIELLGVKRSLMRLFKQRSLPLSKSQASFLQTCQICSDGINRMKLLLSGDSYCGKVGLVLDRNSERGDLAVTEIQRNSPSKLAGILVGDILIKVGETEVQNLEIRDIYSLLRGEPHSNIYLVIKRGDRILTFQLVRQRYRVFPSDRQGELLDIVNYLQLYFGNLINTVEIERESLDRLNAELKFGKTDLLRSWMDLQKSLAALSLQIKSKIAELLNLKQEIFIDYPSALEDINLFLSLFNTTKREIAVGEYANIISREFEDIDLLEIDRRLDSFLVDNPDLSEIESALFNCYLRFFSVLNEFYLDIASQRELMKKIDIVEAGKIALQHSKQSLSNLTQYIETWRGKLVEDLEKIDALEQAQPLFSKVLEISVELGNASEALILSEKSRARAFADMVAARFPAEVHRDLVQFRATNLELSSDRIQELARLHSATIVEYFVVSGTKIHIWIVQPDAAIILKTVELNSDDRLQGESNPLLNLVMKATENLKIDTSQIPINSLEKHSSERDLLANSQAILIQLYQLLIEPIEDFLKASSSNKVIIIPHDRLFLVPFASLFDPKTNKYAIEEYTLVLSPSIQILDLIERKYPTNTQAQKTLVIGNPQMPSFGNASPQLPQLPYTESAAKAISNLFKVEPILGKQATKTEVLTKLPQAKIIHFGTHGKLDDTQPLESGIALTPEGEDGGFLTVGDILARFAPPQTLSLNAELVVLSACSTGLGRITGDGVIGLARGLMAAGAKTVLVSLWEVRDLPTACLMLQFYKYLHAGDAPALALKQAQVWLKNITNVELLKWLRQEKLSLSSMEKERIKNRFHPFQHPYYWGAFYIMGG